MSQTPNTAIAVIGIDIGKNSFHVVDWQFGSGELIQNLTITIKTMLILSSNHHRQVMNWLSHLPYPWCPAEAAAAGMPPLSELSEIHQFLMQSSK